MQRSTLESCSRSLRVACALLPLAAPLGAQTLSVQQASFESPVVPTSIFQPGGAFGRTLAAEGNRLYIGAPWEEGSSGGRSGAIYVYERESTCYRLVDKILGTFDREYGDGLAVDGNTLAFSDYSGHVRVMIETPSGWVEQASFDSVIPSVTGVPVDLSGDTLVIGARNFEPNPGSALAYTRVDGVWSQDALPSPDGSGVLSGYGRAVAIDGDVIAIGSVQSGRVQMLRRDAGGVWQAEPDVVVNTFVGDIDIEGDRMVVGSGSFVRMYDYAGGVWVEQASFPLTGGSLDSVALEGNLALAGMPGFSSGAGTVYWFEFSSESSWVQGGTLAPSDPTASLFPPRFGTSVALEGGTAFVGAEDFTTVPGVFVLGKAYAFADEALPAAEPYCTAGTSSSGCQALLSATGSASASATSGFDVFASGVEGAVNGLFFLGPNGRQANPWGNGTSYQCVVPPVSRTAVQTSTGTSGVCDGAFSADLNATWCSACPMPGLNFGEGTAVQLQLWYRDAQNTSNQTTGLSDALEFCLEP